MGQSVRMIYDPRGLLKARFTLGVLNFTNIMAKIISMFQGVKTLVENDTKNPVIIGDSRTII